MNIEICQRSQIHIGYCLFVLTVSGFWEDVLYHLGIVRYGNNDYIQSVVMHFYIPHQFFRPMLSK